MTEKAAAARPRRDSLRLRVLSAVVGLPVLLAAIWLGGLVLLALGILVALAGLLEFRALTGRLGTLSVTVAGAAAIGFMLAASRGLPLAPVVVAALVVGALLWHLGRHITRPDSDSGLAGWALTVAGALYPGALLSFGLALRGLEDGWAWLLLAVLATFASDTGAYFSGRAVGRNKLAPTISPGKTWEGAVGGLISTALAVTALMWMLDLSVPLWIGLPAGAGISLLAQAGDLAESFLKRAGGVKEAGWLVPGHGGILDRLDSVVLVLPAAYYGLVWLS